MKIILKIIFFCFIVILLFFGISFHEYSYPSIQMVLDIQDEGIDYRDITVAWYKRFKKYEIIEHSRSVYTIVTKPMRGGKTTYWNFTIKNQHPTTFKNLKITWKGIGQAELSINDIKSLPQETRPSDSIVYILNKQTFLKYLEE